MQSSIVYLLIGINLIITSAGQILQKIGVSKIGVLDLTSIKDIFKFLFNPYIFSGLFLYGIGAIIWISILSRANLSFAYPMISLSYILIILLSKFIFNEPVTAYKWAGIILITLGASLIGLKT